MKNFILFLSLNLTVIFSSSITSALPNAPQELDGITVLCREGTLKDISTGSNPTKRHNGYKGNLKEMQGCYSMAWYSGKDAKTYPESPGGPLWIWEDISLIAYENTNAIRIIFNQNPIRKQLAYIERNRPLGGRYKDILSAYEILVWVLDHNMNRLNDHPYRFPMDHNDRFIRCNDKGRISHESSLTANNNSVAFNAIKGIVYAVRIKKPIEGIIFSIWKCPGH